MSKSIVRHKDLFRWLGDGTVAAVARVAHLDVLEACFALRAGDTDRALEHLSKAFAGGPLTREWAQTDSTWTQSAPTHAGHTRHVGHWLSTTPRS